VNYPCDTVSFVAAVNPDLAVAGRAIADPARAAMLLLLMDGRPHTAKDLALAAGVSASAATAHLHRLVEAGFVRVRMDGRQKLHTLVSPEVAAAVEALAAISPPLEARSLTQSQASARLRTARSCYSHLGGRLAVTIADRLAADGAITGLASGSAGRLSGFGHPLLTALGIDGLRGSGPAVRGCLDWTEGRPHVAGQLGSALLRTLLEQQWLLRRAGGRALTITARGGGELERLGITLLPEPPAAGNPAAAEQHVGPATGGR
jgi:DNA-binding transcriptional ArsR family regulator